MPLKLVIGPEAILSYRRLAYTPWHAIAEFVDNSTQSCFDNREALDSQMSSEQDKVLSVSVVYDRREGFLRVVDNAMGMSLEELERALHVALPPPRTDGRSKYGMGMKTAACWLGNRWTITTKKLGDDHEHSVTVDVEEVAAGNDGGVVYSKRAKPRGNHYTILQVVEMHRVFHGNTIRKIRDFLRSMYRSDLRNGILRLRWREQELTWGRTEEQLYVGKDGQRFRKEFEFEVDGKAVTGWVGILDRGSRADAGFSILQADRVIMGWPDAWRPSSLFGQLLGSNDLVNQRLLGEIHLDGFEVSHTKDSILWRGTQEEEVERKLRKECGDYRDFARLRRKGKEEQRGPSDLEVKAALEEVEKELLSPEMVDKINISVVPSPEIIEANKDRIIDSVRGSGKAAAEGRIGSEPAGIRWKIFLEGMSPNDPYVVGESAKGDEITVIVNKSHPYWASRLSTAGSVEDYLRQCVYDSVAEWQARAKAAAIDPDTIKLLKDQLLRVPLLMEVHEEEGSRGGPSVGREDGASQAVVEAAH